MTFKFTADQEAWLRDLETTDAEQARGVLYDPATCGYCCLGRAYVALGVQITKLPDGDLRPLISASMQKRLKLHGNIGELVGRSSDIPSFSLASLNDNKNWSFKEIAAFIRANPEAVFTGGAE